VATTTVTAGWRSVFDNFWPQGTFQGYLNCALTGIMIVCLLVVLVASMGRWYDKATERSGEGVGSAPEFQA
jgi:hypothetical protein